MLMAMNKRIDLADDVLIINKGYIVTNTKEEIDYTKKQNKQIKYVE